MGRLSRKWKPRRLTNLWTSAASYRDSFAFTLLTLLRVDQSVFLDASAPDGSTRGHEVFMGASKQDMLTKFMVCRVEGNR
jgi:hypothetical protein